MIHAENVNFSYHTDESVLKAVCLKEEAGHCIALLGNNGVGKSDRISNNHKISVGL